MEYLADTVAIVRHFSETGFIGKSAKEILKKADLGVNTISISIISIVEIMYLSERNKIPINIQNIKEKLSKCDNYQIVDLNLDIVEVAKEMHSLELHDKLIVATARFLNIPILTSDFIIADLDIANVIWR